MSIYEHEHFVKFIVYFNENQDYFECHEVLEQLWKEKTDLSKRQPIPTLILIATSLYHWRRGNYTGAKRTMQRAIERFHTFSWDGVPLDVQALDGAIQTAAERIERQETFQPFRLLCEADVQKRVAEWSKKLPLLPPNDPKVIDKHRYVFLQKQKEGQLP